MDTAQLNRDLSDEQSALDEVVAGLDDAAWSLPTPSDRWSVADQIADDKFLSGINFYVKGVEGKVPGK